MVKPLRTQLPSHQQLPSAIPVQLPPSGLSDHPRFIHSANQPQLLTPISAPIVVDVPVNVPMIDHEIIDISDLNDLIDETEGRRLGTSTIDNFGASIRDNFGASVRDSSETNIKLELNSQTEVVNGEDSESNDGSHLVEMEDVEMSQKMFEELLGIEDDILEVESKAGVDSRPAELPTSFSVIRPPPSKKLNTNGPPIAPLGNISTLFNFIPPTSSPPCRCCGRPTTPAPQIVPKSVLIPKPVLAVVPKTVPQPAPSGMGVPLLQTSKQPGEGKSTPTLIQSGLRQKHLGSFGFRKLNGGRSHKEEKKGGEMEEEREKEEKEEGVRAGDIGREETPLREDTKNDVSDVVNIIDDLRLLKGGCQTSTTHGASDPLSIDTLLCIQCRSDPRLAIWKVSQHISTYSSFMSFSRA